MASIPFIPKLAARHSELTGSKRVIVYSIAFFVAFILWASIAKVYEVT